MIYAENMRTGVSDGIRPSYAPECPRPKPSSGVPGQVCIDGRMLGVGGTGVAMYAEVLASCLFATGASPAVLVDGHRMHPSPPTSRLRRWCSALRGGARWIERQDGAPPQWQSANFDRFWSAPDIFREAQIFFNIHGRLMPLRCGAPPAIMHWTYPVPLYLEGARNLYTIHDLIPAQHPGLTPISPRRHARLLRRIGQVAHRLVTVSEASRAVLIAQFGCSPDAVVNTYQAVHVPVQRDPPLPAGLTTGEYFLFCGTVERRKNLVRLIEAFQRSGITTPLVIAGPDGWGAEDVAHTLKQATVPIRRIGGQPRDTIIGLIRRARGLCFPSLAEGFGLPVAEAMTLGTPVLTSNQGALAEIAGGAALMVDPLDVEAIAGAIRRLDDDRHLRDQLRAAGFERARMFAADAYAERLRLLYVQAMQSDDFVARGGRT